MYVYHTAQFTAAHAVKDKKAAYFYSKKSIRSPKHRYLSNTQYQNGQAIKLLTIAAIELNFMKESWNLWEKSSKRLLLKRFVEFLGCVHTQLLCLSIPCEFPFALPVVDSLSYFVVWICTTPNFKIKTVLTRPGKLPKVTTWIKEKSLICCSWSKLWPLCYFFALDTAEARETIGSLMVCPSLPGVKFPRKVPFWVEWVRCNCSFNNINNNNNNNYALTSYK